MYAADISLVRRVERNITVTPVLAAPENIAGIAGVKAKVVTVLKLGKASENANGIVIFNPAASGDLFGVLFDKVGDITDSDALPKNCEIIDVNAVAGGLAELQGGN